MRIVLLRREKIVPSKDSCMKSLAIVVKSLLTLTIFKRKNQGNLGVKLDIII